jgi:hypothetical protein
MKGLIVIDKSAVGTDSFLGEFGMNLSKQARAVAIPVSRSTSPMPPGRHSSSVGPIDETSLPLRAAGSARRGAQVHRPRREPVVARVPLAEAGDGRARCSREGAAGARPVPASGAA